MKPKNLVKESSGQLKPLASTKKLQEIIKKLEEYMKEVQQDNVPCTATIKEENWAASSLNKKSYNLYANEIGLISVALRILNIATFKEGAHYHLDAFSGELDDDTKELVITKTDNDGKCKVIGYKPK